MCVWERERNTERERERERERFFLKISDRLKINLHAFTWQTDRLYFSWNRSYACGKDWEYATELWGEILEVYKLDEYNLSNKMMPITKCQILFFF